MMSRLQILEAQRRRRDQDELRDIILVVTSILLVIGSVAALAWAVTP